MTTLECLALQSGLENLDEQLFNIRNQLYTQKFKLTNVEPTPEKKNRRRDQKNTNTSNL